MLKIVVPAQEFWNETTERFVYTKETTLQLEHSLVSISKWESKHHKPFLGDEKKTPEELMDYIKCMTITQNVDESVYNCLTKDNIDSIMKYIEDPMTATFFSGDNKRGPKRIMTSELIYYYMFANQIDIKCEKWPLNRLITLIRIFGEESNPKKRSKADTAKYYAKLNEQRRKMNNSRG